MFSLTSLSTCITKALVESPFHRFFSQGFPERNQTLVQGIVFEYAPGSIYPDD